MPDIQDLYSEPRYQALDAAGRAKVIQRYFDQFVATEPRYINSDDTVKQTVHKRFIEQFVTPYEPNIQLSFKNQIPSDPSKNLPDSFKFKMPSLNQTTSQDNAPAIVEDYTRVRKFNEAKASFTKKVQVLDEVNKSIAAIPKKIELPVPSGYKGNIDLNDRSVYEAPDGHIETEFSMTVRDGDEWLLIPSITPDGKKLSNEAEALDLYKKTGQYLAKAPYTGKDSWKQLEPLANAIHERQGLYYQQYNGDIAKQNLLKSKEHLEGQIQPVNIDDPFERQVALSHQVSSEKKRVADSIIQDNAHIKQMITRPGADFDKDTFDIILQNKAKKEQYLQKLDTGMTQTERDFYETGKEFGKIPVVSAVAALDAGTLALVSAGIRLVSPTYPNSHYSQATNAFRKGLFEPAFSNKAGAFVDGAVKGLFYSAPMMVGMVLQPEAGIGLMDAMMTQQNLDEVYKSGIGRTVDYAGAIVQGAVDTAIFSITNPLERAKIVALSKKMPVDQLLKTVDVEIQKKLVNPSVLKTIGVASGSNAVRMMSTYAADNIVNTITQNKPMPTLKEFTTGMGNAFLQGVGGGVILGGAGVVFAKTNPLWHDIEAMKGSDTAEGVIANELSQAKDAMLSKDYGKADMHLNNVYNLAKQQAKDGNVKPSTNKTILQATAAVHDGLSIVNEAAKIIKTKPDINLQTEPVPDAIQLDQKDPITALAQKIASGSTDFTPDELQLQKNNPVDLEKALSKIKQESPSESLSNLKDSIDGLIKSIDEKKSNPIASLLPEQKTDGIPSGDVVKKIVNGESLTYTESLAFENKQDDIRDKLSREWQGLRMDLKRNPDKKTAETLQSSIANIEKFITPEELSIVSEENGKVDTIIMKYFNGNTVTALETKAVPTLIAGAVDDVLSGLSELEAMPQSAYRDKAVSHFSDALAYLEREEQFITDNRIVKPVSAPGPETPNQQLTPPEPETPKKPVKTARTEPIKPIDLGEPIKVTNPDNQAINDQILRNPEQVKEVKPDIQMGKTDKSLDKKNKPVDFTYALVPIKELITSHNEGFGEDTDYPQILQERNRENFVLKNQVNDIYKGLQPELLGTNIQAKDGAPIVVIDKEGRTIVLAGNGRTIALKQLNNDGKLGSYDKFIKDNLQEFGLPVESSVPGKILVRVYQGNHDIVQLARDLNSGNKSKIEIAVDDANLMLKDEVKGDNLIELMDNSTDDVLSSRNSAFVKAFFDKYVAAEPTGYLSTDGKFTPDLRNRIEYALFMFIFNNKKAVRDVLSMYIETDKSSVKSLVQGIIQNVKTISKFRNYIKKYELLNLDITPDIATALVEINNLRVKGIDFESVFDEQDIFSQDLTKYSDNTILFMRTLIGLKSVSKADAFLSGYYESATEVLNPEQEDLLIVPPDTREEFINEYMENWNEITKPKSKNNQGTAKAEPQSNNPEGYKEASSEDTGVSAAESVLIDKLNSILISLKDIQEEPESAGKQARISELETQLKEHQKELLNLQTKHNLAREKQNLSKLQDASPEQVKAAFIKLIPPDQILRYTARDSQVSIKFKDGREATLNLLNGSFQVESGTATGRMTPAINESGNLSAIIDIAMNHNKGNTTLYHEGFHLAYLLFLNNGQRVMLHNYYKQKTKLTDDVALEEAMAEDFGNRSANHSRQKKTTIQLIWDKLLERIRNFLISLGIAPKSWKVDQIFQNIREGKHEGYPDEIEPNTRYSIEENYQPTKTIKAYKLFRTLKSRPGEIFPLFIGKQIATPIGKWIKAEFIPTPGFAERPGWHSGIKPQAPHLLKKDGTLPEDRVWAEIEVPADVDWQAEADKSRTKDIKGEVPKDGYYRFATPKLQGGTWIISGAIKVNRLLSADEVTEINNSGVRYSLQDTVSAELDRVQKALEELEEMKDNKAAGKEEPIDLYAKTDLKNSHVNVLDTVIQNELKPVIEHPAKMWDWMRKIFNPVNLTPQSKETAMVVRVELARIARQKELTFKALTQVGKFCDSLTKEQAMRFFNAVETGTPVKGCERFIEVFHKALGDRWKQIQEIKGTDAYIENYFPHIWKEKDSNRNTIAKLMGKRPLEGSKEYFKKRAIPTITEGLALGLELASYNPIDLLMARIVDMDKFIMANAIMEEFKSRGLVVFASTHSEAPDGWVMLNDPMGKVFYKPTLQEFFDQQVMDKLNALARSLGIKHERLISSRTLGSSLGVSITGMNVVQTKIATPEAVLLHEIGHQLDPRFNLQDKFVKNPLLKKEIRALVDLKYEGKENGVSNYYKKYVRKGEEKVATLFEAYLHIPDRFKEVAPNTFREFEDFLKSHPETKPILDIKPSLVYGMSTETAPYFVHAGDYYMPEAAALVMNNYLSPGLRGNPYYDAVRMSGNLMNMAQLGLSMYHGLFTSLDAITSRTALNIQKVFNSSTTAAEKITSVGEFVTTLPLMPYTLGRNLSIGHKGIQNYLSDTPLNPEDIDLLERGGARVRMDSFYLNNAITAFMRALHGGNYIGAVLHSPGALMEVISKPLMQWFVPRQKIGVYLDGARFILSQSKKEGWEWDKTTLRLQEFWDSVDNRMGQMVYDNLFWNKILKDVGMASVRSLGWNLGDIRELPGGVIDMVKVPLKAFTPGERANIRMTPKMAYCIVLPLVIGLVGALLNYIFTGETPKELKDYYFPRTGRKRKDGTDERISLPSYMKDVYAYSIEARKTISNKLHPQLTAIIDMLNNHDYFGTEIRNPDDPLVKQIGDIMGYQVKQFVPFSITNMIQREKAGTGSWVSFMQSFAGITPAPAYIVRTPIQNKIYELYDRRFGGGIKSKVEREKQTKKSAIRALYYLGKDEEYKAAISQAVIDGIIIEDGISQFKHEADIPPDIKLFKQLPTGDQESLIRKMKLYELNRFAWYVNDDVMDVLPTLSKEANAWKNMKASGATHKPRWKRGLPATNQFELRR